MSRQPLTSEQRAERRKRNKITLSTFGALVVVIVVIAALSGNGKTTGHTVADSVAGAPSASASPTDTSAAPVAPQYTVSQQSAVTAAEQYLSMGSGFSREGLIQQLDSSAGSGFSVADAKFAVNHITVNWHQQAALAAKGYMSMGGFSHSSLVQQLESSAGSGFTHAQAVYGAKSVGL